MLKNAAVPKPIPFSLFKSGGRVDNPTIAAGDFKVDIDGAGQNNVATPPTCDTFGRVVWQPSQAETNGDVITLLGKDAAGDEWEPVTIVFETQMPTSVEAILADTAVIGAAGAGLTAVPWNAAWDAEVESEVDDALGAGTGTALTAIPWNAAWDAEVQSEATDALNAYDPPTNAEMEAMDAAVWAYATRTLTTAGKGGRR